jgi:cellulose synthase/poly-beta-1,6-N-acetylglucosamine synthase-like glycosyltransferase
VETLVTAVFFVLIMGVSTTFWSLAGLGRAIHAQRRRRLPRHRRRRWRSQPRTVRAVPLTPADVAVIVAAHNEELVIAETIQAASRLVDTENIHVVSDGSTDDTALVALTAGAHVLELNPNRGKAGALTAGIEHFQLCDRFEVVLLLDADTHLAPDYLTTGLSLFDDPEVVVVAGRARTIDDPAPPSRFGRFLIAYRERLYLVVQLLLKFGQAAKWANAVAIVPGFASMYRTDALARIDVTGAGLVIEDFNMTFEVHAKKLGRIEFHPSAAVAYTQDPDTFREYVRQVRRWILGFWQTVRRHRFHTGVFWFALAMFIVELITSSLLLVLLVPLLIASMMATVLQTIAPDAGSWSSWLAGLLTPQDVLIGVLLPDYLLTIMAVCVLRQPRFLLLGLGFPLMRIVDAAVCLRALSMAWFARSSGVWVSPTRRAGSSPPAAGSPGHPGGPEASLISATQGPG